MKESVAAVSCQELEVCAGWRYARNIYSRQFGNIFQKYFLQLATETLTLRCHFSYPAACLPSGLVFVMHVVLLYMLSA